jgi:hypothetical protein
LGGTYSLPEISDAVLLARYSHFRLELASLFNIEDNSPCELRTDSQVITHLFTGYDGSVHIQGYGIVHWHGLKYSTERMQQLPSFLQHFPDNYTAIQKLAFRILKKMRA